MSDNSRPERQRGRARERQREREKRIDTESEKEREKSTVLTIFREVEVKSSQACNFHNIS